MLTEASGFDFVEISDHYPDGFMDFFARGLKPALLS